MAKEDLTLNIKADVRKATAEIKKINKTLEQFKKEQKQIQKETLQSAKSLESFNKRITQMAHITASLAGLDMTIGKIIDVGEAFEKSISKLGAISKASSVDLALLSDKAKELGLKTQYSAKQVADAMNYEAMAGMKTNQILAATKDILDLASVGNMDLARASDIATDTMSAFGMKADEVGKITDIMAVTITNSNTNVEQLGEAFKNVAPVAHNLGLSIEQTSAMLGILADSGKKGGEAGTHLKIILQRLASQTKQVQDGFKKLGISAYDSNGKLKPMTETLTKIKDKLKNLNDKQKNTILKDLFGEEAISSANIILNNLDKMDIKLKKISNSEGEAAKMAKKMNDNLAGDKLKLYSALESLANNLYESFLPALRQSTQALTEFVQYLSENSDEIVKWGKIILETTASIYALNKAMNLLEFLKLATNGGKFVESLALITSTSKKAVTALLSFASANPILLALSVTIAGVTYYLNELEAEIEKLNNTTNKLNEANKLVNGTIEELYSKHLNKATKQLELTNEEVKKYKKNIDDLIKSTKKQIETAKENSDGSVEYRNIISELNKKLKLLEEAQKGVNNAKIIQEQKKVTQNTNKQAKSIETLTTKQKKYIKSLDDELKKQTKKKQTLKEWYQFQLKKLDEMLQGTKEYYLAKEKIEKIYLYKLKDSYNKRIVSHTNTINKLEEKEKNLSDKIVKINKDLQNKLKTIELSRINAVEDIENKIHNISISNLSSYMQYNDKKKQSDILYNKAKMALQNGELSQAKRYMSEYESIVSSLANTEIKENGKVLVSKKQSNNEAIKGLKTLEELTNSYYDKEKQKAIEVHNQKIAQLKAQLTATKSQLELEVQRLNLEKQMIELLTGQKVDIDISSALKSIEEIDKQIKNLDNQIETPKKIELDTKEAKQKAKIDVEANTKPAQRAILEVKNTTTGEITKIPIGANTKKAVDTYLEIKDTINGTTTKIKVNSDTSQALAKLNEIPKVIVTKHIIKTIEEHNSGGIVGVKFATGGKIDNFERKNGRINGYDPSDSDDVPALLTRGEFVVKRDAVKHYGDDFLYRLNNKLLPKFATGGMVEQGHPQKLITELKSGLDNDLKEDITLDTSKLDKYLDKLNELLNTFRNGGANNFTAQIQSEISKITQIQDEVIKDENRYKNDINKHQTYTNKLKGKTLSKEEYKKYKDKNKTFENIEKSDKTKLNNIDIKKIKQLENELQKFVDKIENYLKQVDIVKNKIQSKLSTLNIDTNLFPELENNLDLNRLNNFYNALNNTKLLNKDDIQLKFNEMVSKYLTSYRSIYYSNFSNEASRLFLPPKPKGIDFVKSLGIDDRALAQKYDNILKYNVNVREFGSNVELGDEILSKTKLDYLKQHLPMFKTGGLNGINGGKLNGYGGGDRNLALLEDGEFIVRKEAVSHFGADFLHSINNIKLPKFQMGGMIDFNSLPKFRNGGEIGANSGYTANINFTMPSGNNYRLNTSEEIAKALSQEFKSL